jgi:hypothetical protein
MPRRMRRPRRPPTLTLLNAATAASLLFGIAACVLSNLHGQVYFGHNPQFTVACGGGTLDLAVGQRLLSVPLPLVAAIGLLFPLFKLRAVLARRDQARLAALRGHCPTCGYDLRATPDRCPECGAVPAPPPA